MKPIMLIDVDGVIADFTTPVLKLASLALGKDFTHSDVTDWDYRKALGLSDLQWRAICRDIEYEGFANQLEPYDGAVDGVNAIAEHADVYFVTSDWRGSKTWVYDRNKWLMRHFGDLGRNVIHTSHKRLVYGDVLVDDKPENVERWTLEWPTECGILWDRPYNRQANYAHLRRHSSWRQILKTVTWSSGRI